MYASLHNRSAYSFGSSLIHVEALPAWAAFYEVPAIALTDLHGLYGAVKFQQACGECGIKPIFGTELWIDASSQGPDAKWKAKDPSSRLTVTLLAQTMRGYTNLCRLISLHHLREADKTDNQPRLMLEDLIDHAEDVICLAAGIDSLSCSFSPSHLLTFSGILRELHVAFRDRLYVELAIHSPADVEIARKRARLADELGIPVVATSESRCLHRNDNTMLRALASIGTLTLVDRPHPDKPEGSWHLRTPAEMKHLFARRADALDNTRHIADQCNVTLDLTQNRFPAFASPDGRPAIVHLREICLVGCQKRYIERPQYRGIGGTRPRWDDVTARLDRELRIIEQVRYAEYFLVFHEIVEYCNREGIATLARGSAADSLVCYALGVSQACPFRFDLPFDRFVNPERAKFSKMADIDLDLPWDQRDQVIRWVYDRWGNDRVAMIGTANSFHARAAVAELGKAYGLPAHEVYKATKFLPHTRATGLAESVKVLPEARDIPVHEEPYRTILRTAGELEGLPRHWAMHPCGIVISPEPLGGLVPVQRSPKGPLIAQYDMHAIEDLGFIKIDLLGQAGLSVLRDTVAEVKRTEGVTIDLENDVDYSEPQIWDMIASGDGRGVHHIESPAMTSLLVQSQCRDIDCLTTIVALIRPGAANQGKKEIFCRRHQGMEAPTYAHPTVIPVLEKTYGLMIFEEHILQIAVEFAGMNVGRADVLRRGLNKENRKLIAEMRTEFRECARQHGRTPEEIEAVWALLNDFAGFMFNKAHSAEYALEAFQGAWLKHNWPAHYLAAILSNYRGFYAHSPTLPQILYVLEAMRLGARFLPPCVNRSRRGFAVEKSKSQKVETSKEETPVPARDLSEPQAPARGLAGEEIAKARESENAKEAEFAVSCFRDFVIQNACEWTIRTPISHIKGMPEQFVERWWTQRLRGEFVDVADFLDRCRPAEAEAQLLLDTGSLDCFGHSRPELFWHLRRVAAELSTGLFASVSAGRADCLSLSSGGAKAEGPEHGALPSPLRGSNECLDVYSPGSRPGLPTSARSAGSLLPVLTPPDTWARARRELDLLEFPITIDPFTFLGRDEKGRDIDWTRYTPINELHCHLGRHVRVCGILVADRINLATTGDLMKFVTLADRTGFVETILFPDTYRRLGHLTTANPIVAAAGIVEPFENNKGFTLRVQYLSEPRRGVEVNQQNEKDHKESRKP